ncbi:hypothetical protein [Salinibacter altiplanensis]|uniref:hypothetical protein n=1 Tax=Salinibacter altiplanensis TaxID=1803181 RepID=UPI000C9FEEF8|nr:hypothetical protein [Salinibacter altiplanensis]
MPESDHSPGSTGSPGRREVTYDSVTIHYRAEEEEPLTVERVHRLTDSSFPGSGERALQVIDDPWKKPIRGLFEVDLILIPPEEISHLVLREGDKETTATVEEVLSG